MYPLILLGLVSSWWTPPIEFIKWSHLRSWSTSNQCSMFPAMGGRQKKKVLVGKKKKSFTIGLLEPVRGGKWRNDPGFSEHIILLYWVQERGGEGEKERERESNTPGKSNISKPHWNSAISVISPPDSQLVRSWHSAMTLRELMIGSGGEV